MSSSMCPSRAEVLVTGTFNVLHPGHIRLLEFASRYGKVTVGINSDAYLRNKYGDKTISLIDRSYALKSIIYVDDVVTFWEDEPSALIKKLKPKYYIKGPDYSLETLPELPAIRDVGAFLIIHPSTKEYSASELAETLPKTSFNILSKYS